MKAIDFIQVTNSHNLKDPHSKALEPDCISPLACDYDTVSQRRGKTLHTPSRAGGMKVYFYKPEHGMPPTPLCLSKDWERMIRGWLKKFID